MLENTFQHGGKTNKNKKSFLFKNSPTTDKVGDIIPLCHTQNGLRRSYQTPLTVRSYDTSEPVFFRLCLRKARRPAQMFEEYRL